MVSRLHRYPLLEQPEIDLGPLPRMLFLGTCGVVPLMAGLKEGGVTADHLLWESLAHSPMPRFEDSDYDAIVVSLTLVHIFSDAAAVLEPDRRQGNGIYLPRAIERGNTREFLDACISAMADRVNTILPMMSRRPAFFLTFTEPKHNYLGNLMPRYSLSNPMYFVQKMNEALAEMLDAVPSAYLFDTNEILHLVGSGRLQDDYTTCLGHGSMMMSDYTDANRIQPSISPTEAWGTDQPLQEFQQVLATRFLENLAIIRSPLQIKAIIVDADDTLWRGVAVEWPDHGPLGFTEGWPIGFAEALLFFKARGGLIALCSKNDEQAFRAAWPMIYHGRLRMADFAAMRVNFDRKSDNIREILSELNLLPQNVLFVDDNPREIDEVRSAFPTMHFMSADHHDWRRRILMTPTFQVASISADAALRTSSIQANVARQAARVGLSYDEWLLSLELQQTIVSISSSDDPRFDRALELLNKTNQFNTTGRRWERHELQSHIATGGDLVCSFLKDKLADNGMICVVVVRDNEILQVVLSCRAFKYSAEVAAARYVCQHILQNFSSVKADLIDTGKNKTCHDYFSKMGFELNDGSWTTNSAPACPDHLNIIIQKTAQHAA